MSICKASSGPSSKDHMLPLEKNIFRKQQSGHIKCSASEALGVFGVVRLFLITTHGQVLRPFVMKLLSYMKLCEVFDVIQACKNNFKSASDLHHAIHGFVTAHLKAWGSELWLPKHHYLATPSMDVAQSQQSHVVLSSTKGSIEWRRDSLKIFGLLVIILIQASLKMLSSATSKIWGNKEIIQRGHCETS